MCQNHCTYYGRLFMKDHPQFDGFFRTRAVEVIAMRELIDDFGGTPWLDEEHDCLTTFFEYEEEAMQRCSTRCADLPCTGSRRRSR